MADDVDSKGFIHFKKEKGKPSRTFVIRKDTELKILSGTPTYKVVVLETEKEPPELVLETDKPDDTYPRQLKMVGKGPHIIGRDEELSGKALNIPHHAVSRDHISIHLNNEKRFIISGNNRNPICIKNAEELDPITAASLDNHAETVVEYKVPGAKEEPRENSEDLPLRMGMRVVFSKAIPAYRVAEATGGDNPRLRLVCEKEDPKYPSVMEAIGKNATPTIGRGGLPTYDLGYARMHRGFHSMLSWNEASNEWMLFPYQTPPVLEAPAGFFQAVYAVLPIVRLRNADAGVEEIRALDKLIDEIQEARPKMENVQFLEQATMYVPPERRDEGGHTEDSQRGYLNWLKAYQAIFNERLDDTDHSKLDKAVTIVDKLEQDRATLRPLERYNLVQTVTSKDAKEILQELPHEGKTGIEKFTQEQCEKLHHDHSLWLVSGFKRHHTVTHIEEVYGGDYTVTVWNAGGAAKDAGDGANVMAMYQQRLHNPADVDSFVRLVAERKVRAFAEKGNEKIAAAMEEMLSPEIDQCRVEPPQHRGNCTTRSTREMLKDVLGKPLFEDVHRHVSNPQVCDPADIMAALQLRRQELEKRVQKLGVKENLEPENPQGDWIAHSIHDVNLHDDGRLGDSRMDLGSLKF